MLKFLKNRIQNQTQLNKDESASGTDTPQMRQMRKRIGMQAGLAVLTVVLTLVLIFAMTAAWYTNVVQTSGLIFQVEQWGVDVGATISSASILAAPGDVGIVDFQVNNTGTDIVNVAVSVTKNAMDPVMQRRLYFYVDDQKTTNQEVVQRVYLNSESGYDYLLFGGGNLTVNETYYNDAPLKWCWVYDVLGYYVRMETNSEGVLEIAEYLRPIEYNYDQATFDADTGALATVNGVQTAQDFLVELSKNDGYAGTIDTTVIPENGYYPVKVDATTGRGVYAYLLNFSEIQQEMDTDTALGAAAGTENAGTYVANFTIYAENFSTTPVAVNTAEALSAALTSGTTPLIQLTQDIELSEALTLSAATDTILDLGGYTLTTNTSDPAITAPEGSSLAVTNGTLTGAQGSGNGFTITGADVTLNDVVVEGYQTGFRVADYSGTGVDSTVKIIDSTVNATAYAVLAYGNGSVSEQTTKIIIEDSTLYGDAIAISGNGTITGTGRWGTDIQIINSTVGSNQSVGSNAIYHPQPYGTLNIVNSTVIGHTALIVKGGTVTISKSTITGTGPAITLTEPGYMPSGAADTGDAVYIEDGYSYDIYVEVDAASTLTSYAAQGLRVYLENSTYVTLINNGATINEPQQTN